MFSIEEKKPFSPSDVKIEFGHEFKRLKKNSDVFYKILFSV